ncbi:hypothetical protein EYF80_051481 [Liparis tanakae]|uniref:Uncharacterized protein n=1 Tax=Liparis tanakae TaxID=230148 RepID=A0A4Z2FAZ0_9TELE|nr:hypothetical protein EYF80_051481 [Liparis tanakae]
MMKKSTAQTVGKGIMDTALGTVGTYLWVLQTFKVRVQVELDARGRARQRHAPNQQHDEHDERERGRDVDHLWETGGHRRGVTQKDPQEEGSFLLVDAEEADDPDEQQAQSQVPLDGADVVDAVGDAQNVQPRCFSAPRRRSVVTHSQNSVTGEVKLEALAASQKDLFLRKSYLEQVVEAPRQDDDVVDVQQGHDHNGGVTNTCGEDTGGQTMDSIMSMPTTAVDINGRE